MKIIKSEKFLGVMNSGFCSQVNWVNIKCSINNLKILEITSKYFLLIFGVVLIYKSTDFTLFIIRHLLFLQNAFKKCLFKSEILRIS